MDFPDSGGPIKMDSGTSTDTELCFLRDSWYATCHSKKTRSRGLCATTSKECSSCVGANVCLLIVVYGARSCHNTSYNVNTYATIQTRETTWGMLLPHFSYGVTFYTSLCFRTAKKESC